MKVKFIVGSKDAYFYSVENDCVQPYEKNTKMHFIKKICEILRCPIPSKYINSELFGVDKIVITDAIFSVSLLYSLKKKYDSDKIFLFYFNTINSNNKKYMQYFDEKQIYTFDQEDAKKYAMKYVHTPYSKKIHLEKSNIEYDTIFLGYDKGRCEEIEKVYTSFVDQELTAKIMVLNSKNKKFGIDSYMDYKTYLKYVSKSKSILEINMENQVGCTVRFGEALFLEKKLITNNKKIVEDEYYRPENVFVLGVDSENELIDFLKKPCVKVQNIDKLEFENWILSFGSEE